MKDYYLQDTKGKKERIVLGAEECCHYCHIAESDTVDLWYDEAENISFCDNCKKQHEKRIA